MRPEASQPTPATTQPQGTCQVRPATRATGARGDQIQNGTLGYRDDRANKVRTLGLSTLEATAASPDSPLHVERMPSTTALPSTWSRTPVA